MYLNQENAEKLINCLESTGPQGELKSYLLFHLPVDGLYIFPGQAKNVIDILQPGDEFVKGYVHRKNCAGTKWTCECQRCLAAERTEKARVIDDLVESNIELRKENMELKMKD